MKPVCLLLVCIAAAACSAGENDGTLPPPSKVVEWSASGENLRPAPDGGTIVDITLRGQVEPGWKVYSLTQGGGGPVAMSVKLDSLSPYKIVGDVQGPASSRELDSNFGIETETYEGEPTFTIPVHVPVVVDRSRPIELKVRSQACNDKLCLPARTVTVSVAPPLEGA